MYDQGLVNKNPDHEPDNENVCQKIPTRGLIRTCPDFGSGPGNHAVKKAFLFKT